MDTPSIGGNGLEMRIHEPGWAEIVGDEVPRLIVIPTAGTGRER